MKNFRDSVDPSSMPAWKRLVELAHAAPAIAQLIEQPRDFLRVDAAGVSFDFSRQRLDSTILAELGRLAQELAVEDLRDAMFAGEHINTTEGRAVLHTALRAPRNNSDSLDVDGQDVLQDVQAVLQRMQVLADDVRTGSWRGATGEQITDVVNIGIGGSDLGPAMAYQALRAFRDPSLRCHFVSNVDPADISNVLAGLDPARTLVIVASKTFTTHETMANAQWAKRWITTALGEASVARHFVAVSTNAAAVGDFGIDVANMFEFWDWVGGRYSMDSAIGLSLMIAIGPVNFQAMLDGFAAMDAHFASAPLASNVPMLMGLLAVWNRNFLEIPTTAVLPYSQDLARFPAYLQQLVMESNGKSVRRDGVPVTYSTSGVYWGEPGTNAQHSFFQLLHKGTDNVASDIIVVAEGQESGATSGEYSEQHAILVANALAQAAVLSVGVSEAQLRSAGTDSELIAHKVIGGNHPTTVIMMPALTPFTLGALIAAYEHSVFVQGAVWQINSFDQWGVELGKKVAANILNDIHAATSDDDRLDPATRTSLELFLSLRDNT